ncbi:MAG TPA: CoA-acylating methylmalonate-semialdehyde dehydrogenase [Kofleriaceae bacterium]|nr:CoA-acylating methylmalonate-semialdehyde dehydrogenase [Kofleriaceae bacterium]
MEHLRNYMGGAWIPASSERTLELRNPATGEPVAVVPLSAQQDVDRAVTVAVQAFATWRRVPAVQRARTLFRYKNLLEKSSEDIARTVTIEHGKTLDEARGEVRRGIENVEHACGIPALMMGETLEDVAAGIDCETFRQPIGVFAAVTPFNFPAMVPLWFWPYAVATGNTFIVKPSEITPLSQQLLFELAHEAGFPAGVVNLVHGDREVAQALVEHPDVAGLSFVGSSDVARAVYQAAAARGKRVQALGGAKNHVVVMADCELERTVETLVESCFGCAGQRCLAPSVVIAVDSIYDELRERLVARSRKISVGNGLEPGVAMGPLVSGRHLDRVHSLLHVGLEEGARLLLDGRGLQVKGHPDGVWMGPTILEDVADGSTLAREEIFGPVMVLRRARDLDEAVAVVQDSPYANATSIFTQSGKIAREFRRQVGVSMIGVNVGVAAPMAFFPFGGTRGSFLGDLKAHGTDAIRFFTDAKVVISRWF